MNKARSVARWRRVRLAVLERDGWRCRKCGRAAGRLEVDHIVPLNKGGAAYELANLQALCRGDHFRKSAIDRGGVPHVADAGWERLTAELLDTEP